MTSILTGMMAISKFTYSKNSISFSETQSLLLQKMTPRYLVDSLDLIYSLQTLHEHVSYLFTCLHPRLHSNPHPVICLLEHHHNLLCSLIFYPIPPYSFRSDIPILKQRSFYPKLKVLQGLLNST